MLISHDLAIVRYAADAISVMYLGRIVEDGPAGATWETPLHPYTEALIGAVPHADGAGTLPEALPGEVPDPARPPHRLPLPSSLPVPVRPVRGRRAAAAPTRRRASGRLLAPRRRPHATPAARESGGLTTLGGNPLNVLMFADTVRSPELRHEIPHTVADPFLYGEVGDSLHGDSLARDAAHAGDPEPRGRPAGAARLRRAARRGALVGRGRRSRSRRARAAGSVSTQPPSRPDSRSSSPTSCARRASRSPSTASSSSGAGVRRTRPRSRASAGRSWRRRLRRQRSRRSCATRRSTESACCTRVSRSRRSG